MDFAGTGAHRNESRTIPATNGVGKKLAKLFAFPEPRVALQMAA
jgi:hypothetical protein